MILEIFLATFQPMTENAIFFLILISTYYVFPFHGRDQKARIYLNSI
jgi:hypothetical protein